MEPVHISSLLRRASLCLDEEVLAQSLEVFDAFLRSERFAVETYDEALQHVLDEPLRMELTRLRNSHDGRVCILAERIAEFGGTPPERDGTPCGAFANAFKRIRGASDSLNVLEALREGEHWAVRDYEIDLAEVAEALRNELMVLLLEEQRRTREHVERLAAGLL